MSTSLSLAGAVQLAHKAHPAHAGKGVYWTDDPSVELPIRLGSHSTPPPITVIQAVTQSVSLHPSLPALRVKRGGRWLEWSFSEFFETCKRAGRALLHPAIGLLRFQGVGILAFNSPEWAFVAMGCIFAGGLHAGIYTTNTPDAVHFVLDHCDAVAVLVDDEVQLAKVLAIRSRLPHLRAIILSQGELPAAVRNDRSIYDWNSFLALGDDPAVPTATLLAAAADSQAPGHACALIYTSGTTGQPKGVMLSHDNVVFTVKTSNGLIQAKEGDIGVSYLPLSHIAAQMTDLYGSIITGGCVCFAQPDALKGSLVETLKEVRPTMFFGVPRVWEKIEEKMRAVGAANTGIKKSIGEWAKSVGTAGTTAQMEGSGLPLVWPVANAIVFSNIKKALGMDRCRFLASGAAPISKKTLEYFASLDMCIHEVFGMSESTGPHTVNTAGPGCTKFCTVGRVMPGLELRLAAQQDTPSSSQTATGAATPAEGEVCMRGRNVFMGYFKNAAATREAIDADGWLHSGDLGTIDSAGFLRITGRIKELVITAGGENVAPVAVEDAVKAGCAAISNAMLIGDKRKFVALLVTFKVKPDADGAPTTELDDPALAVAAAIGSTARTSPDAARCPKFRATIQDAVTKANALAVSNAARVQRWVALDKDFSVQGGELTPTLKLKRRVVQERYSSVIDRLYSDADAEAATPRPQPRL